MNRIPVALFGTGAAGLEFIESLDNHPEFQLVEVYGHSTAGTRLGEILFETWELKERGTQDLIIKPLPNNRAELIARSQAKVFCSALSDGDAAKDKVKALEGMCASVHPTFSTTSVWRYEEDSCILVPEVNFRQADKLKMQAKARGWDGFIAPGPNCTTVGPVISLHALFLGDLSNVVAVYFDSKQAVSGAGRAAYEELLAQRRQASLGKLDVLNEPQRIWYEGNVRCNIKDEEMKVKKELRKISGANHLAVNGMTNRVATEYGHVVSMFVETREPIPAYVPLGGNVAISNDFYRRTFGGLHSAPANGMFIRVTDDDFGPQPLLEAELYGGMCTHIGQINLLDGRPGLKYTVLSHNLKKGAAKGSVLVMEHLRDRGYF